MNKQLRDEWVKALRSGEYKQARRQLRVLSEGVASYCCLGVLGKICGIPEMDFINDATMNITDKGLSLNHKDFLVGLNDLDRKSFSEIADWIEQNIPVEDAP